MPQMVKRKAPKYRTPELWRYPRRGRPISPRHPLKAMNGPRSLHLSENIAYTYLMMAESVNVLMRMVFSRRASNPFRS